MKTNLSGINFELTDALTSHVDAGIAKFQKFSDAGLISSLDITLIKEGSSEPFIAKVNAKVVGVPLEKHVQKSSDNMYESISEAFDVMHEVLSKVKDKRVTQKHKPAKNVSYGNEEE